MITAPFPAEARNVCEKAGILMKEVDSLLPTEGTHELNEHDLRFMDSESLAEDLLRSTGRTADRSQLFSSAQLGRSSGTCLLAQNGIPLSCTDLAPGS